MAAFVDFRRLRTLVLCNKNFHVLGATFPRIMAKCCTCVPRIIKILITESNATVGDSVVKICFVFALLATLVFLLCKSPYRTKMLNSAPRCKCKSCVAYKSGEYINELYFVWRSTKLVFQSCNDHVILELSGVF